MDKDTSLIPPELSLWSSLETKCLLALWSDATVQSKLDNAYRNNDIDEERLSRMREKGNERKGNERKGVFPFPLPIPTQNQIQYLKMYIKAKDCNSRSGNRMPI
jgi:hypothetical protein